MKAEHSSLTKVIAVILSVLMIAAVCPVATFAEEEPAYGSDAEALPLVTLSDIHYYPQSLAGSKGEAYYTYLEGSSALPDDMEAMLDATFESLKYQIENEGVKYVILVGDLTTNGEYEGNVALAEKLHEFKEETGCTIYLTDGNHDINNANATSFVNNVAEQAKMTTPADFVEIYNEFGFSEAYHTYKTLGDGTQGCLSYSIKTPEGYRFIFADGGKYSSDATSDGEDYAETAGNITNEQLEWIISEAEDATADGEIPLLFTHWNMSGMNYFHEYLLQGFVIDNAYKLQETLADAGIHYTFSGHQHVTDLDITYSDSGEPMYSIITPTLTQYPFSYRTTTFSPDGQGNVDVQFDMMSIDEHSAVKTKSGGTYPAPYRLTGFNKQYSGVDGTADFLWKIVKKMLDNYVGKIRKEGSIVSFLENEFGLDLEALFNKLLNGGIYLGPYVSISGKNLMSLVNDLDEQLMQSVIYPKAETYSLIKQALINVCNYQISDVPCTKFMDSYGFGDTSKGGTLGDLLASALVYLYYGNEDASDDMFMQDILAQTESTDFVDKIFTIAVEEVVSPIVIDDILANTDLHIEKLFVNTDATVTDYIQMVFRIILAVAETYITATGDEGDLLTALSKLGDGMFNTSFTRLIDTVLGTGLISYGTDTKSLVYGLLDKFFDEENKKATAYQLNVLLKSILEDEDRDWDVTYTYCGPVKVKPTAEDMQLPTDLAITFGEDASTSFYVTWYTKYSVKNTDIDFTCAFDGTVEKTSEDTTITGYGFDFGSFGILPWTRDAVKHTVKVTGLQPGTEYTFTVGDTEHGFISDECTVKTAPRDDSAFSFIAVADSEAITPAEGQQFANTLSCALNTDPDAAFLVNAGTFVREPDNDDRWSYILDESADSLRKLPVTAAAGADDTTGFNEHLTYDYTEQMDDSGVFYSYDYGNAHFIVLNANNVATNGALNGEQIKWLRSDLSSNDSTWNILVINGKLWNADDTEDSIRIQLMPYILEYGIDLAIEGGTAYYARTGVLSDEGTVSDSESESLYLNGSFYNVYSNALGIVALNPGTSAMNTQTEEYAGENTAAADGSVSFYSVIKVDGNVLTVDSYSVNGYGYASPVDSFGLKKTLNTVTMGDTDSDEKITAADARLALRYAIGFDDGLTDTEKFAADVDGDVAITVSDARVILRAAIELETLDPAEKTVSANDLSDFIFNLEEE